MSNKNQISNFSDAELLMELVLRNGKSDAPTKTVRVGQWFSTLIAIGCHNVAEICLTDDAMEALEKMSD